MKFASRISSIRRHAWKTLSSWSPDSAAMWRDSFASPALAGWMRSPQASSTWVTGGCASQSMSSSGRSARSSRAIATSRHAWPRPIGEETNSARRRRRGRAARRRAGRAAVGAGREVLEQLVEADRVAGVRAVPLGAELDELGPGRRGEGGAAVGRDEAVVAALRDERRARQARHEVVDLGEVEARRPERARSASRASVSSPQPTESSICFVECGSSKQRPKKNSR